MSDKNSPVAIAAAAAPLRATASHYPEPFASRMAGREKRPLGTVFGLSNFGVNLTRLAPGAAFVSDNVLLCQLEARPDCRARAAAPLPAIERIRHTPRRCPDRSRPDRPTRGSRTNTGGAVRASHWPDAPQSSY